jgi:hypothetical protein
MKSGFAILTAATFAVLSATAQAQVVTPEVLTPEVVAPHVVRQAPTPTTIPAPAPAEPPTSAPAPAPQPTSDTAPQSVAPLASAPNRPSPSPTRGNRSGEGRSVHVIGSNASLPVRASVVQYQAAVFAIYAATIGFGPEVSGAVQYVLEHVVGSNELLRGSGGRLRMNTSASSQINASPPDRMRTDVRPDNGPPLAPQAAPPEAGKDPYVLDDKDLIGPGGRRLLDEKPKWEE